MPYDYIKRPAEQRPKTFNLYQSIEEDNDIREQLREKARKQAEEKAKKDAKIRSDIENGRRVREQAQLRYKKELERQKQQSINATLRRHEQTEAIDKEIKKNKEQEDSFLQKQNEKVSKEYDKEFAEWAKEHSIDYQSSLDPTANGAIYTTARGIFWLQNALGSALKDGTSANMDSSIGEKSTAEIKQSEANAHDEVLQLNKSLNEANNQINLYKEIYAPKPGDSPQQRNDANRKLQEKLTSINQGIAQIRQRLNDPQLKQLDENYKIDSYVDNDMGFFNKIGTVAWDAIRGISIVPSKQNALTQSIANERRKQLLDSYNKSLVEKYNALPAQSDEYQKYLDRRQEYKNMLLQRHSNPRTIDLFMKRWDENNKNLEQRLKNNANISAQSYISEKDLIGLPESEVNRILTEKFNLFDSIQTKKYIKQKQVQIDQAQKDYDEAAYVQNIAQKYLKVSDAYLKGQQLNQNASLFDINYWNYVVPGMIGSSWSSTDQIKSNIAQYGAMALGAALAAPTDGLSLMLPNIVTAATIPMQFNAAMEENYGEIGSKRAEVLADSIYKYNNVDIEKGIQTNPILDDLRKKSIKYWKQKGMSDKWIEDRYKIGDQQSDQNIMRDYIMGFTKNNDPRLIRALFNSQLGLKAQFEADNVRTMGELPVQIAMQFIPTKFLKQSADLKLLTRASKQARAVAKKVKSGEISKEVADRWAKIYGEKYANSASKFRHGLLNTRSVAAEGYEQGASVADMLGFGYGGHVIGGAVGSIAKPIFQAGANLLTPELRASAAEAMKGISRKYQYVYDKLLPKTWMKIAARYGLNALNRGAISSFSEGAEEGVQYLNSQEDFAKKYGFDTPNIAELFANDWAQGSRVAKAYLSLIGLSRSELKDDEEFWQNVKGGFALGFGQPAIMNTVGTVPGAIRQYKAEQVLVNSTLMDREVGKLNRVSNVEMAKQSMAGRGENMIVALQNAYEEDKRRSEGRRMYRDEDYDDKLEAARSINAMTNSKQIRKMLEAKGIEYNTEEYATAIADIYEGQRALIENNKQTQEHNKILNSIYGGKEYNQALDAAVQDAESTDIEFAISLLQLQKEAADKAENDLVKSAKEGEDTNSPEFKQKVKQAREDAEKFAKEQAIENFKRNVRIKNSLTNRFAALLNLKQKTTTLYEIYERLSKLGLRTKKPDAKTVKQSLDSQIKQIKKELGEMLGIDANISEEDLLKQLTGDRYYVTEQSEDAQDSELAIAMLKADKEVTQKQLNMFEYGIVKNKKGEYEYNEKQYLRERDKNDRISKAIISGKSKEEIDAMRNEDVTEQFDEKAVHKNAYKERIGKIIETNDRNARLDWMVNDMYNGDAVSEFMENAETERNARESAIKSEIEEKNKQQVPFKTENQNKNIPVEDLDKYKPTTTDTQKPSVTGNLSKSKQKYLERKQRAKEAYENRKKSYKNWKKGNLNAAIIPFQDAIVKTINLLMRNAEIGAYTFARFVDEVKDIANDVDISEHIPFLKQRYISLSAKLLAQHPEFSENLSTADEVIAYGVQEKPVYIRPEITVKTVVQDRLIKDEEKVDQTVSSYYDTIVVTDKGPILCVNREAAQKAEDKYGLFEQIANKIRSLKNNEQELLNYLQQLFEGTPVQHGNYIKYINIPGIEYAIARNASQHPYNEYLTNAIKARNAVIAVLLGNENELNPAEYPSTFDQFIQDAKRLRTSLLQAGYKITSTVQNIYDESTKDCEQADIILSRADGKVIAIDVLTSYKSIRKSWDVLPNPHVKYTTHQRENDILHKIEYILSRKFEKPIDGLYVLPIIYDSRHDVLMFESDDNGQKLIQIESQYANLDENLPQLKDRVQQLVSQINERVDECQNLISRAKQFGVQSATQFSHEQYSEPASTQIAKDQIVNLEKQLEIINENIAYLEDQMHQKEVELRKKQQQKQDFDYYEDYIRNTSEDVPQSIQDKLAFLDDLCSELDRTLDLVPQWKAKDQSEKDAVYRLYQGIFDVQNALNDVLTDPEASEIDVTDEESLIAHAMEVITENRNNFGDASVFMQKWWLNNFVTNPKQDAASFVQQIQSWCDTLQNHVLYEIENRPRLQAWYNSILNNYFSVLIKNAKECSSKLNQANPDEQIIKTKLDITIERGDYLIQKYNEQYGEVIDPQFPPLSKEELDKLSERERINRMQHVFKDKFTITHSVPLSWDAMSLNTFYYYMSIKPDFAQNVKVTFYIAPKDYTPNIGNKNDFYTIKAGDVVAHIVYKGNFTDLPITINEKNYPNATKEELARIHRIQKAQNKLKDKIKKILEYQKSHPNTTVVTDISVNKGSIRYERSYGVQHNVSEFLFKNDANKKDLYTIRLSLSDNIGICKFEVPKKQGDPVQYGVYAGGLKIGQFDQTYLKQQLNTNSGSIVYFYNTGNNDTIGIPIEGSLIGQARAQSIVNLIVQQMSGNTHVDGFEIKELLNQVLYVFDPTSQRKITKYNSTGSIVQISNNGFVQIGDDRFNLVNDRNRLVQKIANMNFAINEALMNENMFNSSNPIFVECRSKFQQNPSLTQLSLPNGMVVQREDFLHQNTDKTKGSTVLGYMMRNNMLVTRAIGQSYTQLNIDDVRIEDKDNASQPVVNVDTQRKDVKSFSSNLLNMIGKLGGSLTYRAKERPKDPVDNTVKGKILDFMSRVLGDAASEKEGTLIIEDNMYLEQIENEYVLGLCNDEVIKLCSSSTESVAYHEAFHKIFELLIPENVRDTLYDTYRKKHKSKLSDRQIAEDFADLFMHYMEKQSQIEKAEPFYKKIIPWFKKIAFTVGMFSSLGRKGRTQMLNIYKDTLRGKYKNAKISDKQRQRFKSLFGDLNFSIKTKEGNSIEYKHLNSNSDVTQMVNALGFYIAWANGAQNINNATVSIRNTADIIKCIPSELRSVLRQNPAFAEIFEHKAEFKYDKTGRIIGQIDKYPKLQPLVQKIKEYLDNQINQYAGKRDEDELQDDPDEQVMNKNIDKYDRPSYEFSKLSSIPEGAKFFFASVPYLTWEQDEKGEYILQYDVSKNKFGSPTLMPVNMVYQLVVNNLHDIRTPQQLLEQLERLSKTQPMFLYLYNKFNALVKNAYTVDENGSVKINYDDEAYMLQITSAIRSFIHTFVIARAKRQEDGTNKVDIIESSLDRDSRQFASQWTTYLLSGQVSVFKRERDENGNLIFNAGFGGQNGTDIFNRTASNLQKIKDFVSSANDTVTLDDASYNRNVFSDIVSLKEKIINDLNKIGIIFSKDAFDHMLSKNYNDLGMTGLYRLFTDKSLSRISTFIDLLQSFVDQRGNVNNSVLQTGYSKNGFVKMLGQFQGEYNRITIQAMSQGLGGKRYYNVSQNNSISNIIDMLNTNDPNNPLVKVLTNFGYNLTEEGGFYRGSIILQNIMSGKNQKLQLFTYLGLKTDNKGDTGTEYKKEPIVDDYITKMAMLQSGILVFPTLADKGTWMCIKGVNLPGMQFNEVVDAIGNTQIVATNVPTIKWYNGAPIIYPATEVLDQMISYAKTERLAICQCMEDLGYDNIPGYEKQGRKKLPKEALIKNYHTKSSALVKEPNGTRFLQLKQLVVLDKNGNFSTVNLNDPTKSSTEMLKLANENFFSKSLQEQRDIMAYVLNTQYSQEVSKAEQLGLITRKEISANGNILLSKDAHGKLNLQNVGLNGKQIEAVTNVIFNSIKEWSSMPIGPERNARYDMCTSLAIASILADATTKSIMSSQEVIRCFSGHPAAFKVQYDNVHHCVKDDTFDIQKRIGGMISTGEDNAENVPGIPPYYTCAECKDFEVTSGATVRGRLKNMFEESAVREAWAIAIEQYLNDSESDEQIEINGSIITDPWSDAYKLDIGDILSTSEDVPENVKKAVKKAQENAEKYANSYLDDDSINVADGAAYVTADMCKNLLRLRGKYTDRVKQAFDLLASDKKLSWQESAEAYKIIYDGVNLVTTKYTAYGMRNHTLNGEQMSDLAVPYYNKYSLAPLFPCMATGRMADIYQKMLDEKVDVLLMTSAVKVGSQGAIEFKQDDLNEDGTVKQFNGFMGKPFNTYIQDFASLRRQLNTDPEEKDKSSLGTQLLKIALQNLRLERTNYIDAETGQERSGQDLLKDIMYSINALEDIGKQQIFDELYTNGSIDEKKLSKFLTNQLNSRNASKGLVESFQLDKNGKMKAPVAATSDATWIQSILISVLGKRLIDVITPGNSFVQRSVFAMEGSSKNGGAIKGAEMYNGKRLQMVNEDGSMDAVISIDYFEQILPNRGKGMSFNQAREWLIKNGIIGDGAKANTIGYRIPTQAQSSIHALRFVDVVSAVKCTIILPQEFTKVTGSDFDIDHLYLATLNYKTDENGNLIKQFDEGAAEYHQNKLLNSMLTLLKDCENSMHSLYKSIDNDTELPKKIADKIPEEQSNKAMSYNFGTLHEQADRRLDYVTGKDGIGPFALNVTNSVLTYLFGVKFRDTEFTRLTGVDRLDKLVDKDQNSIASWISAFINAHVDIVKDPWVSKMGVDSYTYNMVNLLVRCGFGDAGMWFIAQPIIRDMAYADKNASSEFMRNPKQYSSIYRAKAAAVTNAIGKWIDTSTIDEKVMMLFAPGKLGDTSARVNAVNWIKENAQLLEDIATNKITDGVVIREAQKNVYFAWKTLEPYSMALNALVQYTKVDTKKYGKSFLELDRYYTKYNQLMHPIKDESGLFDHASLENLDQNSWIYKKTHDICTLPFDIMNNQLFEANRSFISAVKTLFTNVMGIDADYDMKTMQELSTSFITQIKSQYIIQYAHEYLNMTDQDVTNLFIGNYTISRRFNMLWNQIRTNPKYSRLKNNQLLTHLYSLPNENPIWVRGKQINKPEFLSIADSIEDDRLNSDLMSDGWLDLLNDEDKFVRKFARDLIIYSFLTSGEYKGWNKLFKYVPTEWIFGEVDNSYVNGSFSDYIKVQLTSVEFDASAVVDEIIQNHFTDYKFSTKMNENSKDILIHSENILVLKQMQTKRYVTVKNSGTSGKNNSDYSLYRYSGDVTINNEPYPIYAYVPKKGYSSINGRNSIYEYGWNFNYNENKRPSEIEKDITYDIDYQNVIEKMRNFLQTMPNIKKLEDDNRNKLIYALTSVYYGYDVDIDAVGFNVNKQTTPLNPADQKQLDKNHTENTYEVSTKGDSRFSALNATFKPGTIIDGVDVGGKTIEYIYQTVIKKSGKGQAPAKESRLYNESLKTKEEREDFSYTKGYLPLWQEWAKQNPDLIADLAEKAKGKTLTDRFANTRVSQARALMEILNEYYQSLKTDQDTPTSSIQSMSDIEMTSGGAYGADTAWDFYARQNGITKINHYRDAENQNLSSSLRQKGVTPTVLTKEEMDFARQKEKEILGKYYPDTLTGNLQVRNFYQVYNADGVFAIAVMNSDNKGVSGGTNTAVQLGIALNKSTYVFDPIQNKWFEYNQTDKVFESCETPILTKRFAGVGTRDIQQYNVMKDGKFVPKDGYLGQQATKNAFDAIQAVMQKTKDTIDSTSIEHEKEKKNFYNIVDLLGGDRQALDQTTSAISVAARGIPYEMLMRSTDQYIKSIFTKEESRQIKEALGGKPLQVMSVSRTTDPAFFSKQIIKMLEENSKKPFTDPTRINCIELWTKHDGQPVQNILKACKKYKVAPIVSFSITSLGATSLEQGVMRYRDLITRIKYLIKNGDLNPLTTTIRIDPILAGVTNMEDIKNIVNSCKQLGIKKFVTSLVQSYGNMVNRVSYNNSANGYSRRSFLYLNRQQDVETLKQMCPEVVEVKYDNESQVYRPYDKNGNKITILSNGVRFDDRGVVSGINKALSKDNQLYDWDTYYGKDKFGNINFIPKQEYIDQIGAVLLELNKDENIDIQTCSFAIKGLKPSACLDPFIIERVTGVDVISKSGMYDRDTSRPQCMCYSNHSDMFRFNEKKCFSSCAYCYAAHGTDRPLNYYTEDGRLKYNEYTRLSLNTEFAQQKFLQDTSYNYNYEKYNFINDTFPDAGILENTEYSDDKNVIYRYIAHTYGRLSKINPSDVTNTLEKLAILYDNVVYGKDNMTYDITEYQDIIGLIINHPIYSSLTDVDALQIQNLAYEINTALSEEKLYDVTTELIDKNQTSLFDVIDMNEEDIENAKKIKNYCKGGK